MIVTARGIEWHPSDMPLLRTGQVPSFLYHLENKLMLTIWDSLSPDQRQYSEQMFERIAAQETERKLKEAGL